MRRYLVTSVLCALLVASCAAPRHRSPPPDLAGAYPGELRSPRTLGAQLVWRQIVDATWPEGSEGFDAAVQVQGDTMLVVGLSPIGRPGFVIRLTGTDVEVDNESGMELPIPPRFVLLDVQRVSFPWFEGERDLVQGERSAVMFGERVTEVWTDGRLAERRFERVDGEPAGVIRVTYEWGRADWIGPTRAVLDNGWYGYRLDIRTHAETRIDDARGGA